MEEKQKKLLEYIDNAEALMRFGKIIGKTKHTNKLKKHIETARKEYIEISDELERRYIWD